MKRPQSNPARVRQDADSRLILAGTRVDPANEDRLTDLLSDQFLQEGAALLSSYGDDLGKLMDLVEDIGAPRSKPQASRLKDVARAPVVADDVAVDDPIGGSEAADTIIIGAIEEEPSAADGIEDILIGGDPIETFEEDTLTASDIEDIVIGETRIDDIEDVSGFAPENAVPGAEDDLADLSAVAAPSEDDLSADTPRAIAPKVDPLDDFELEYETVSTPETMVSEETFDLSVIPDTPVETIASSDEEAMPNVAEVEEGTFEQVAPAEDPAEDDFEILQLDEDRLAVNEQISAHLREDIADESLPDVSDVLEDLRDDFDPEDLHADPDEVAELSGEVDFSDMDVSEFGHDDIDDGFDPSDSDLGIDATEDQGDDTSLSGFLRAPSSLPEPKPAGFEEDDWFSEHLDGLQQEEDPDDQEEENSLDPEDPLDNFISPSMPVVVPKREISPVSMLSSQNAKFGDFDADMLPKREEAEHDAPGARNASSDQKAAKSNEENEMNLFAKKGGEAVRDGGADLDFEFEGEDEMPSATPASAATSAPVPAPTGKGRGPLMTILLGTAVLAIVGVSGVSMFKDTLFAPRAVEKSAMSRPEMKDPVVAPIGNDTSKLASDLAKTPAPKDPKVKAADASTAVSAKTNEPASGNIQDLKIPAAGDVSAPVKNSTTQMQGIDKLAKDLEKAKAGDMSDLFDVEKTPAPVVQGVIVTQKMLDGFALKSQSEESRKAIEKLFADMTKLQGALAETNAKIADDDKVLDQAMARAEKAEALAMAQNEVLVQFVRVQEKVDMAEKLIVDLSKRVAKVETTDPADRVAVERALDDMNSRLENMARDIGLIARMSINGSPEGLKASASPAAADAKVPGASAVYESAPSNAKPASGPKGSVPAGVKVGDFVTNYGRVLDIIPTSDGARLVVMENGSALVN